MTVEYLYILVIMQYLFNSWCTFFLIFTCLHLNLWLSRVNSTMPVTVAALYIECFQVKGIPVGKMGGRAD